MEELRKNWKRATYDDLAGFDLIETIDDVYDTQPYKCNKESIVLDKFTGKYYQINWKEYDEEYDFEDLFEVKPVEVTVIKYEKV